MNLEICHSKNKMFNDFVYIGTTTFHTSIPLYFSKIIFGYKNKLTLLADASASVIAKKTVPCWSLDHHGINPCYAFGDALHATAAL
jgi:hypothetical protein